MVKERDILNFACRYHRNGISGEGFYACSFIYRLGRERIAMQAAVFPNDDNEPDGRVAVLSHDVATRWRGDDFEPVLRAMVARAGDEVFSA